MSVTATWGTCFWNHTALRIEERGKVVFFKPCSAIFKPHGHDFSLPSQLDLETISCW